jgi:hypothetical protein
MLSSDTVWNFLRGGRATWDEANALSLTAKATILLERSAGQIIGKPTLPIATAVLILGIARSGRSARHRLTHRHAWAADCRRPSRARSSCPPSRRSASTPHARCTRSKRCARSCCRRSRSSSHPRRCFQFPRTCHWSMFLVLPARVAASC